MLKKFIRNLVKSKLVFLQILILINMFVGIATAGDPSPDDTKTFLRPAEIPQPDNNRLNNSRVELGKTLFFDPRLSGTNSTSCATCHNPSLGWSDGLKVGIGAGQKKLTRATPTLLNSGYQRRHMWDGRSKSLEDQALKPIESKLEMNQNLDELMDELNAIKGYHPLFEAAYPGEGINRTTVAKALASFQRSLVSSESPFDRWLSGKKSEMSNSAIAGFELFKGKARCVMCHQGFNFIDDGFHNVGLPGNTDEGRYALKKVNVLKGAFKTPTLRNIALTAPYMHNGQFAKLEEVVDHYSSGGVKNLDNLDPNMMPLNLTKAEKQDLIAFLHSLTGDQEKFYVPVLPNSN